MIDNQVEQRACAWAQCNETEWIAKVVLELLDWYHWHSDQIANQRKCIAELKAELASRPTQLAYDLVCRELGGRVS